jgi:hypothetical protein
MIGALTQPLFFKEQIAKPRAWYDQDGIAERRAQEVGKMRRDDTANHTTRRRQAKHPLSTAHIGGAKRINEHIDENLATGYSNLNVCEGLVTPAASNYLRRLRYFV